MRVLSFVDGVDPVAELYVDGVDPVAELHVHGVDAADHPGGPGELARAHGEDDADRADHDRHGVRGHECSPCRVRVCRRRYAASGVAIAGIPASVERSQTS
jgi:hypothetical protein